MGKHKQGICMADGGITQESPEQLMARMAAKYGAPTGTAQPAAQPQAAQPVARQAEKSANPLTNLTGIFSRRKEQIDRATNFANGGIAGHVKFEGKGGPRDDQIPVKVAGQKINVSDGEQALIIPAKTAANAQAMEMIKQIIADSNDGRQPDMGGGDANFANGGLLDEEARKMNYQAVQSGVVGQQARPPVAAPQASNPVQGGVSLGRSPAPTIHANGGLPAPVVQQGIDTMRGQMADPATAAPSIPPVATNPLLQGVPAGIERSMAANPNPQAAPATIANIQRPAQAQVMRAAVPATPQQAVSSPVQPAAQPQAAPAKPVDLSSGPTVSDGAGGTYTPERGAGPGILSGIQNFFQDSARAAQGDKTYDQIRAERAAGESASVAPGAGPASAVAPKPAGSFVSDPTAATAERFPLGGNDSQFITGKAGAMPDSSGGGFTAGNTSYNVNPSNQEGITKVTATGKNPLYTNIRPEDAVAGLKNQSVDGDTQEGLARFARANAIRQEMIDSQPQGGIGILGDGGIEAANAEKTARWRQDDLLAEARRGNQAAVGAAINANASIDNEASRANSEAVRAGVATRGQDLAAKNEAARLAGNPVENQLKQAQTQGIMATTESAQMLADLQKKALAGDPQAMASYLALAGKKPNAATDRYMTVQGGEEIGPDGMTKIKRPSGVFDSQTQQFVSMNGGQPKPQQAAPASALEYLKKNPGQAEAFKAKYGYLPEGM